MVKIKNTKGLPVTIAGKVIDPFKEIKLDESVWLKEFASRKSVREAVQVGMLQIENSNTSTKNKEK